MIGQKGIPATYGGVERHVEELSVRLVERGHEVIVYTRPHYSATSLREYRGVRLVSLPSVRSKHLDAISHVALCAAHAAREGVDVMHFHAEGPALLSWVPRLRGCASVVTIHGQDWRRPKWGKGASLALRAGEWMAVHAPHATICVSETLARELSQRYGRPVQFIPNGVSLIDERDDSILDQFNLEPQRYVLFAARLVPEKGCHYLIEAWRRGGFDMPLVMAGDSSFSDEYVARLKAVASAGGGARIVFPGYVYGARLASLFANAALFVLPSNLEGMPIVLLEALGYGTPVLASDIAPNREVLGSFGRTFKAGSVEDLAQSLGECLGDTERLSAQAQRARDVVRRDYDWDAVASRTIELYSCLDGGLAEGPENCG